MVIGFGIRQECGEDLNLVGFGGLTYCFRADWGYFVGYDSIKIALLGNLEDLRARGVSRSVRQMLRQIHGRIQDLGPLKEESRK